MDWVERDLEGRLVPNPSAWLELGSSLSEHRWILCNPWLLFLSLLLQSVSLSLWVKENL